MPTQPPLHVEIGDIWLDVSVREGHDIMADVTEHPVESGANIADHIRPQPATITIEGMVTNHPIQLPASHVEGARVNAAPIEIQGEMTLGTAGLIPGADQVNAILGAVKIDLRSKRTFSATPLHFTKPFDRVTAVHKALLHIIEARQLVTVVTALTTYQNVALVSLHVERSAKTGRDCLEFQASGRVLRIVNSQTVALPAPVKVRALPKVSAGAQATTPITTTPAIDARSLLSKIVGVP
jgi:Dit-like tail protein